MPVKRGSKFANIKGGPREDLPGVIIRSSAEANVHRVLTFLQSIGLILAVHKETWRDYFPGERTTGTAHVDPDWFVILPDGEFFWVEMKGSLKEGGWLPDVDLESIAEYDDSSRIKWQRYRRYYKSREHRVLLLGQRELRALEQLFDWLPYWESSKPLKKKAA